MPNEIVALTLVKVKPGKIKYVTNKLQFIKGVDEYFTVTGEFDIVIKISLQSIEDLQPIIDEIDQIEGVDDISTHIVVKKYK
ncbi:MAG: Lrp/AsnC ligand binding domain-containing protein [Candidatus Korarchaeota archaeon]